MSLSSSFYAALSGLDTHTMAMEVVGDNISNVNTVGFKSSSVLFEDVLGSSMSTVTGIDSTGVGVKISSIDGVFSQGSMQTTGVDTDVGITGKGFFIVQDETGTEYYTRAGHFSIDSDGNLVNPDGYRVQGYLYDSTGTTLIESLADIQFGQSGLATPHVTTTAEMGLNLDASEAAITTGWSIANPGGTSHYSTAVGVYDTLGGVHQVQVYFTKTAAQTWTWNAVLDGSDIQGGTAGTPVLYGTGALAFNAATGQLTTTMPATFRTTTPTFANGLAASATTVDFTGTTQFGTDSSVQSISQDGYAAGNLSGIAIGDDGTISGNYTNGTTRRIGQLALANFVNLEGLSRKGSQLYMATTDSGVPLYNRPGLGGVGTISAAMLEESNVDLAGEFIKMMINQRGFQANSKVISTTDEMMATLISIR